MSGTIALASAIALMDRAELVALVASRRPQAVSTVLDPIGLASELLRPESIARALMTLNRDALTVLAAQAAQPELGAPEHATCITRLGALGLTGTRDNAVVALPEVEAALTAQLAEVQLTVADLQAEATPELGHDAADTSTWFTAALTSVTQAAEVLRTLQDHPGRLNRSGAVAVATVRAVAEQAAITPEQAALVIDALTHAGLVSRTLTGQTLTVSQAAAGWLTLGHVERWLALVAGPLAKMPEVLSASLRTTGCEPAAADAACSPALGDAVAQLPVRYPLLPEAQREPAIAFAASAEYLGLAVQGTLSTPALALLDAREDEAREIARRELPQVVPGVYIQPDLSVVIPGPLEPQDEAALVALSVPEHLGVASTRRISEGSLANALELGRRSGDLTVASARETLERLSLTGVPQPLEYLFGSLASRVGSIVVSEHAGDAGRTKVTLSRPELGETLLVDRALQHVQFTPSQQHPRGTVLFSRLRAEHVIAALSDAKYPTSGGAAPVDAAATATSATLASNTATDTGTAASAASATPATGAVDLAESRDGEGAKADAAALSPEFEALIDRVFTAARQEPGVSDFSRQLELAIRDRATVQVTAEARGQVRTFMLAPVSLSNGRLRALDSQAGVERTLPVTMITGIEPV